MYPDAESIVKWGRLMAIDDREVPVGLALLPLAVASAPGEVRRLRLRLADGGEVEVDAPVGRPWALGLAGPSTPAEPCRPDDRLRPTPPTGAVTSALRSLRLGRDGEVAYLRVATFDADACGVTVEAMVDQISLLCETARGAATAILDLRGNHGGDPAPTLRFVSAFVADRDLDVPVEIVVPVRASRTPSFPGSDVRIFGFVRVRPAADLAPPIECRLIVLVDDLTASAPEWVAVLLRCTAGAVIVGARTLGAEWSTGEWELPDGSELALGIGGGVAVRCGSFQRIGVAPDVCIPFPHRKATEFGGHIARRSFSAAILAEGLREAGLEPSEWMWATDHAIAR